ncbi:MAG TPA: DEAD/DEAH box helicase, partial [Candidatus Nitrosotenuis sp.]|nr:DEAD/DEAH box helicase [Candidatus Nitrosotenuis sp.]
MISCSKCDIRDIVDYAKNIDEVYLEFLARFDQGQTPDKKEFTSQLKEEGIVRDKKEIESMIGSNTPDPITKDVLFSTKDYISYYKTMSSPEPEFGSKVTELGLADGIIQYLEKKNIIKFYKFQEDALLEIISGSNVVITAPTASGKTEAFSIPIIQKIARESNLGVVSAIFIYPTKA